MCACESEFHCGGREGEIRGKSSRAKKGARRREEKRKKRIEGKERETKLERKMRNHETVWCEKVLTVFTKASSHSTLGLFFCLVY